MANPLSTDSFSSTEQILWKIEAILSNAGMCFHFSHSITSNAEMKHIENALERNIITSRMHILYQRITNVYIKLPKLCTFNTPIIIH